VTAAAFEYADMGGGIVEPRILMQLVVDGIPEPKGSVSAFVDKRTGKARIKFGTASKRKDGTRGDGPKRYRAWCRTVCAAAKAWQAVNRRLTHDEEALALEIVFCMPRPVSTPRKIKLPIRKPDLDKLTRLVADCLTKSEVITDDARIVEIHVRKQFALDGKPCARITIREAW